MPTRPSAAPKPTSNASHRHHLPENHHGTLKQAYLPPTAATIFQTQSSISALAHSMHELYLSAISFTRRRSSSSPSMPALPLPVHSLSRPSPRESNTQAAPTHGPYTKPKPRGFDAAGARASLIPDRELQSPRRACACSQSASAVRHAMLIGARGMSIRPPTRNAGVR